MRLFLPIIICIITLPSFVIAPGFDDDQLLYERVRDAKASKDSKVRNMFAAKGINFDQAQVYFRSFKLDGIFEVWATDNNTEWKLIKQYEICETSGGLGPKNKYGDMQVPEGFYYIDRFNPVSRFHLSLGINYPNSVDRTRSTASNKGGDIFIHGACATIGCIPLTDDKIKEVYWMAVKAKANGQSRIPVHMYPCKFTKRNVWILEKEFGEDAALMNFWKNISEGYKIFFEENRLPNVTTNGSSYNIN